MVFEGSHAQLLEDGRSLTGKYLRERAADPRPQRGAGAATAWRSSCAGARAHNLKGIDVRFPLGTFTCVTGVSGSGKSTLVHDVLCAALLRGKGRWDRAVGEHAELAGGEFLDDVVLVDQSPIGRTPRSNPVTYVKAFDAIRELFAATREARDRGLGASHFSFNVPGGRCEACGGDGQVRVDMQFLADVCLVCESCAGRRYRPAVLEVRYRGRTIDQVLDDDRARGAALLRAASPSWCAGSRCSSRSASATCASGSPRTTLSGGEAQRVKLAAHLLRRPGRARALRARRAHHRPAHGGRATTCWAA